jgi:hypothetical protein
MSNNAVSEEGHDGNLESSSPANDNSDEDEENVYTPSKPMGHQGSGRISDKSIRELQPDSEDLEWDTRDFTADSNGVSQGTLGSNTLSPDMSMLIAQRKRNRLWDGTYPGLGRSLGA